MHRSFERFEVRGVFCSPDVCFEARCFLSAQCRAEGITCQDAPFPGELTSILGVKQRLG